MISDGVRFQRVCRPDSLIRVQSSQRMKLPGTIESIIGPPVQRDLLERVVVPLIEASPQASDTGAGAHFLVAKDSDLGLVEER